MPNSLWWDGRMLKQPREAKGYSAQQLREAFLEGVKAGTIYWQLEKLGYAYCERTQRRVHDFETAMHELHQHHKRQRSVSGKGYQGYGNFGCDHPSNLERILASEHGKEHA